MRTLNQEFLGKEAQFPFGPFAIAAKFDVPKAFVYGFKTGTYGYQFYCTEPIEGKMKPELLLEKYVQELTQKVRNTQPSGSIFTTFGRLDERTYEYNKVQGKI